MGITTVITNNAPVSSRIFKCVTKQFAELAETSFPCHICQTSFDCPLTSQTYTYSTYFFTSHHIMIISDQGFKLCVSSIQDSFSGS